MTENTGRRVAIDRKKNLYNLLQLRLLIFIIIVLFLRLYVFYYNQLLPNTERRHFIHVGSNVILIPSEQPTSRSMHQYFF